MESRPGASARLPGVSNISPVSGLTLSGKLAGPEIKGAGVDVTVAVGEGLAVKVAVGVVGMGDGVAEAGIVGVGVAVFTGVQPIIASNVNNIKKFKIRGMKEL
ncbi:MAG: hypothetical protein LWX83_01330 [Anaerolineae bacterium]|nr:hypothetical protein [Anaerolineae bacterium]